MSLWSEERKALSYREEKKKKKELYLEMSSITDLLLGVRGAGVLLRRGLGQGLSQ